MPDRLTLTPARYAVVARVALVMLTLIVLTGAAVRVTGSGLGCPTWPKCTDSSLYTELHLHGVVAQAVLGGFTVLYDLAPGFVMSHYLLSMLILVACVALDWRAHHEPGELAAAAPADRLLTRGAWALVPP